jgi:hypothetical protein
MFEILSAAVAIFDSSSIACAAKNESSDGDYQEHHEEDLRYSCCARGDPGETKQRCDERNDEKNHCVMKHESSSSRGRLRENHNAGDCFAMQ